MANRTVNSARNMVISVIGQLLVFFITFVSRSVFVRLLGSTYLGVSGLFSNILVFLNLAELGVASAITFSLYKPLLQNDTQNIAAIMILYKKIYRCIGIFILTAGGILTPFIRYIVTSDTKIKNLELYFILYVLNSSGSYFFSYKRTLIGADQKQYINSIYQYLALILQNVLQIMFLYLTHNFIVFLVIQIAVTLGQNIAMSVKADKMYPYLKKKSVNPIDKDIMRNIKKNTGAGFFHKLGAAVVNSTDNVLISKFINIVAVGIYSNYNVIIAAMNRLVGIVFTAVTASVGNIGATEDKIKLKKTFDRIFFMNFWLYTICSVCSACLFQSFIMLWVGDNMCLDAGVFSVVIINFYLNGMRSSILVYHDTLGLYWFDRYKPVAESIINLVASIILVKKIGFSGIFIGTTISCVTTSLWVEPYVVFKYGFGKENINLKMYFVRFSLYVMIGIINFIICKSVCDFIAVDSLAGFILKAAAVFLLSNILLIILFFKSENFKWFYYTIKYFAAKINNYLKKEEKL